MTYGFIGCGNMGGAIAAAVCKKVGAEHVLLANRTATKAEKLAQELGCNWGGNMDAARCDYVFLGVKPHLMEHMLAEIAPVLKETSPVLVTMAAGLQMERIQQMAGFSYPVIRIMPNTPSAIGCGMIQYCTSGVSAEQEADFLDAMSFCGKLDLLDEKLIDAACCVSGCGPAWAYQFIEALADGGVACGLPRDKAITYAAQMMVGAGQLVLESGKHPGALKDAVCSPGGATIQGVRALEESAFRGAVINAVIAAFDRTKEMGKE